MLLLVVKLKQQCTCAVEAISNESINTAAIVATKSVGASGIVVAQIYSLLTFIDICRMEAQQGRYNHHYKSFT